MAYRDHYNKPAGQHLEVFPFNSDIGACEEFLQNLRAIGNIDTPEDVVGGLDAALQQDWKAKIKHAVLLADAPCHGT